MNILNDVNAAKKEFWERVETLLTTKYEYSPKVARDGIKQYVQLMIQGMNRIRRTPDEKDVPWMDIGGEPAVIFNKGEDMTAEVINGGIKQHFVNW